VKVKVNDGGDGDFDSVVEGSDGDDEEDGWPARARCNVVSIAACEGSRREASMVSRAGMVVCIMGGGGWGMEVEDEARASQAAFSSSRLVDTVSIATSWCWMVGCERTA
jgi:hypothetical protein